MSYLFEYISYILCVGLLITITVYLYIRIKYGFWYTQPVYWRASITQSLGIINDAMPSKTKYTNFKDIDTIIFSHLTSYQISKWTLLLNAHPSYGPRRVYTKEQIIPYLVGHNDRAFVSFYYQDAHLLDVKHGTIIDERTIVGSLASRPMTVTIYKDRDTTPFRIQHLDYLCISCKKSQMESQLIETHSYNQRHIEPSIVVTLFAREQPLDGVVPLCVCSTYQFPVTTWRKPPALSAEYTLLEINATNYRSVYEFIGAQKEQFDIVVEADIGNMLELIKTHNIFITAIVCDKQIVACYAFRKSCIEVEKGLEMLTCFASICNCENDVFVQGFKISFWKIAAEHYFGYAGIEDTSHNPLCIQNIIQKTTSSAVNKTFYYFYNFAYPTFTPNRVLFMR